MKYIGAISAFVILLFAFIFSFSTWGTVDAGHRGVVVRMGAVTGEVKGEGFYTKAPWTTSVIEMDVRQKKEQVETQGASKDLQIVQAVIALNLNLDPAKCSQVYQQIGKDYLDITVAPALQEAIKAVIAQYTAEELISKRELVRDGIALLIADKLSPLGIHTQAINIVNFNFSQSFNEAIENKVTAEQNALAAKNLLSQKEYEAQQAVVTAKGEAEALRVKAIAIAQSPQILELNAIEKWNGILPAVMGSGQMPFLNLNRIKDSRLGD